MCLDKKKLKLWGWKKWMKKREDMVGVLVICVPLYSYPIDILGTRTVFLEEDCKKIISISHLLEGNWNFRFLVV